MNKEYTYIDGKVIISDENNKKTQREYYDNLDKVLVQENLIEAMEVKIQELEKAKEYLQRINKKNYIPIILPFVTFLSTIGSSIMLNLLTGANSSDIQVDTILGTMSQTEAFIIPISIVVIPFGIGLEISSYNGYKSFRKKELGINCELDFLKEHLEIAKEYLEELKLDKSIDNEETEFRTVIVDDLKYLKSLKSWLNLFFDLGYNGEKYYKYYKKGNLDKKLQGYYSDAGINEAKKYLEKNGPSLVLKKKKNNLNNSQK